MTAAWDVTLVTYEGLPDLSPDDDHLRAALASEGMRVRAAVWSDVNVDWAASRLTVLRSTWDYFHRLDEFRGWLDRAEAATRLLNAPEVVRWNVDKRYLSELRRKGFPVVPTRFVGGGEEPDVAAWAREAGTDQLVIKPSVSGAAFGTRRFSLPDDAGAATEHARRLLARGDLMVQPYLEEVVGPRERSLVYLAGRFSHAYLKPPFSRGAAAGESGEAAHEPSHDELSLAGAILAACGFELAYARVDLVPAAGGPLLMELELVEPALHFGLAPGSATALARYLTAILELQAC